jgi:hypothetical protein
LHLFKELLKLIDIVYLFKGLSLNDDVDIEAVHFDIKFLFNCYLIKHIVHTISTRGVAAFELFDHLEEFKVLNLRLPKLCLLQCLGL